MVFGLPLLVGIILGIVRPLTIVPGLLRWLLLAIGVVILIIGIGFIITARRELARYHQPTGPGKPTIHIVTSGVFAISRNPLYLGVVIVIAGLALVLNSWWILFLLVFAIILCHFILIFPEERYLASTLADEYQTYRHSVHRWIGRS